MGGKVRPRKGGSDCTRYAVMIYCGSRAAFLMSFHTGRHLFLPRLQATIPHKRVNWMWRMGSVFEPSERKIFAAGMYAATSCGRIGTNGASGSATVEKGPFCGGFGQAERAAEPPRGTGIGGGNPSEPPCEPHPSGGGAACGAPLAAARFQPSGAPKRFWRLVTSPRQRLRAGQTAKKNLRTHPPARIFIA